MAQTCANCGRKISEEGLFCAKCLDEVGAELPNLDRAKALARYEELRERACNSNQTCHELEAARREMYTVAKELWG